MFASRAMDGKMLFVRTHVSWYEEFARYMSITSPVPESGVVPKITKQVPLRLDQPQFYDWWNPLD